MKVQISVVAPAASVSATGNGAQFDLRPFDDHDALLSLDAGAVAGGASYTAKLQHSPDGSTWADAGVAFTAVTTTASKQVVSVDVDSLHRYVRVVDTLTGGTTPTIVRSVVLVASPKYV